MEGMNNTFKTSKIPSNITVRSNRQGLDGHKTRVKGGRGEKISRITAFIFTLGKCIHYDMRTSWSPFPKQALPFSHSLLCGINNNQCVLLVCAGR